jgi:hypothetical protein
MTPHFHVHLPPALRLLCGRFHVRPHRVDPALGVVFAVVAFSLCAGTLQVMGAPDTAPAPGLQAVQGTALRTAGRDRPVDADADADAAAMTTFIEVPSASAEALRL